MGGPRPALPTVPFVQATYRNAHSCVVLPPPPVPHGSPRRQTLQLPLPPAGPHGRFVAFHVSKVAATAGSASDVALKTASLSCSSEDWSALACPGEGEGGAGEGEGGGLAPPGQVKLAEQGARKLPFRLPGPSRDISQPVVGGSHVHGRLLRA